jgi:hypothetical protein
VFDGGKFDNFGKLTRKEYMTKITNYGSMG